MAKQEKITKINNIFSSTRAMVFSSALAALLYIVNFFSGQLLSIFFVVPGLSGIVTGFTVPLVLIIAYSITCRFGTITLVWTLYSTAAIPTALMGPPGLYKIIIGFSAGITFDLIILLFKGKKISYYIGFILYTFVMLVEFVLIFTFFKMQVSNISLVAVLLITLVFIIEGLIAIRVGEKVSLRLKKLQIVKDLIE